MKKCIAALFLAALFAAPAVAQDDTYMGDPGNRHWNFAVYLWAASISGSQGVGGFDVPTDVSFSDILDNLDFAFMGHLEYHADNKFGFLSDLMFLDLSGAQNVSLGRVSSGFETTVLEMALMYNLATRESPFDIFAGFRYWDLDLNIGYNATSSAIKAPLPPDGLTLNGGTDWTDFMIGGRWMPRIGEKWWFSFRADYATSTSDTVNVVSGFDWRFGKSASLWFGYRYMNVDLEEGAGLQRRALDLTLSGPAVALTFAF